MTSLSDMTKEELLRRVISKAIIYLPNHVKFPLANRPGFCHHFGMPSRSRTTTKTRPTIGRSEISRVMAAMGSRGGKIGGRTRAANMTKEERSKSASEAAKARWSKRTESEAE